MTPLKARHELPLTLAVGLAVFVAGLAVAFAVLPEWRQPSVPERLFFEESLQTFLNRAGLATPDQKPRLRLTSATDVLPATYRRLGREAPARLLADERAVGVGVKMLARWEDSPWGHVILVMSGRGVPLVFQSQVAEWSGFLPGSWPDSRPGHAVALAEAMSSASPGDLAEPMRVTGPGGPLLVYGVPGRTDEAVSVLVATNWVSAALRELGTSPQIREDLASPKLAEVLLFGGPIVLRFLLALVVFVVLAFRRRLGITNAAALAVAVAGLCLLAMISEATGAVYFLFYLASCLTKTVFVFVLWSGAESWIRSTIPGFTTSLDALRAGKLGPRSGRSLLGGWAFGAALAGLGLAFFALAIALPGAYPEEASVPLPVFSVFQSPVGKGAVSAGLVLLALVACRRLLPPRWVVASSAVVAGMFNLPQAPFHPWWLALVSSVVLSGGLVLTFQRFGLTGLLAAAMVQAALPAAVFSSLHLSWMPWSFAATALLSLAPPVAGWIGLSRPSDPELARMGVPAFIRRLEEERRVRYEMDLLARMQRGLLPETTPEVEGYEMAATSILANEAGGDLYDFVRDDEGGLWVAAGDVSGHGLSCTIEHAMTKAALTSLIGAGSRPSKILHDVDRVLRTARSVRTFTSMSLLRLDPPSGEVVFSNAGHPYPILLDGQDLSEISLPSLPLGQGPQRRYCDQTFVLRPGSVLVLLSDGLFESTDAVGRAYGYPRTRRILQENVDLSAVAIRDALIADWRRHIGPGSPADDTTLVVVKRQQR